MLMSEEGDETSPPRNVDDLRRIATATLDNSAVARSATEFQSNNVARPRRTSIEERFAGKMFMSYSREIICLFVGIILSLGFAALHSVPPRVSRPPLARPFFNQSSVILDFYKGHLDAMVERASDSDLSFVMYYAPWDAESQAARHEFENVAQYYYSRIFFAAINCWHPGSECRMQYSKIQSYPVLMLYSSRDSGIQYRGIISAPYIMRFLDSFVKPIERITSKEQLTQLHAENDAVVVGFINFKGLSVSPGYKEFYRTATRFLEKDPNRDVAFAIVTDPATAHYEFGIVDFPSASLVMWNETLIYPPEKSFTSEKLLKWIGESLHRVAQWLQPPGVKSLTLAPFLRDGPVFFLFTPRNPLHRTNYNFNLLKQVALQYHSCDGILSMKNLAERLRESDRNSAVIHRERTNRCSLILNETQIRAIVPTVSVSVQQWINHSCCAKIVINKCLLCKITLNTAGSDAEAGVCSVSDKNFQEICKGSDVFKSMESIGDEQQFCCHEDRHWSSQAAFHQGPTTSANKKYESSMLTGENDVRSAKAVRKIFLKDECAKLLAGNKYHYPTFPEESKIDEQLATSTVSACKMNKTLTFIAIDSLEYFHFAEVLGIDLDKIRDKTAVVILDSDQESEYVMKSVSNLDSLMKFVESYTNGLLQRTLRTDNSKKLVRSNADTWIGCEDLKETEVCVPELTTETFSKVVMEPTMNVVVMYHTPYCAFCSAVAYVYLTIAKYFNKMENLALVRIDGDNNDLPWEYSMDRYPSILFFPAKRKEDSTVYPFSLPVTVPNLLNFVLANLEDDSHVEALVHICRLGSGEAPKVCVLRTRRLCLDIIENLLRSYRKLRRKRETFYGTIGSKSRGEILLKLDHIKDIHLILSSVDNLGTDHQKFQLIERKFKTYYRSLSALGKSNSVNGKITEKRKKSKSVKSEQPRVISVLDNLVSDEFS